VDPTLSHIPQLNQRIGQSIVDYSKEIWHNHVKSHTNVSRLWQTIKSIDKGKSSNNNQFIKFAKSRIMDNKETVKTFTK
jgi:hypothetical protein